MGKSISYILLADDDVDDRDLLHEALRIVDKNLKFEMVSSGKSIIEILEAQTTAELPDLIVLDYNIPDLNGPKILGIICNNPKFSAIIKIVWSTSNSPRYKKLSMEAGADYYYEKPQTFSEIVVLARELAALRK